MPPEGYMKRCLLLFLLLAAVPCAAEEQAADYVISSVQPLCEQPGGRKMADVYLNTKLNSGEVRGEWTQVTLTGWIRTNALGQKGTKVGLPSSTDADASLVVSGAEVKKQPGEKTYVTLQIKNTGKTVVAGWQGTLVAQSKDGTVLFQERVSDEQAKIDPQGTGRSTFYWEQNEEPYQVLQSVDPQAISFRLIGVTLR